MLQNYLSKYKKILNIATTFVAVGLTLALSTSAFAQAKVTQPSIGGTGHSASSTNYSVKSITGNPAIGTSSSTNYVVQHGRSWGDNIIRGVIQWAVPESRVGATGTNDDTTFYLTLRTQSNSDDVILWTQSSLLTSNVNGTYSIPIDMSGISPGTYDVGIKTNQHLTRVIDNVPLVMGNNTLDFTNLITSPNYGTTRGTTVLLAGDINGAGTSPSTLGDDEVNSVDISELLTYLNNSDSTGNGIRANLNQDTIVNSVDISSMLANLNIQGDN